MWLSYNDIYDVSDDGQVRNKKTNKLLNYRLDQDGYYFISYNVRVHRMIAEKFLPKIIRNGDTVDHIDTNRLNNNASNLRWIDKSLQARNKKCPSNNVLGEKNICFTNNKYRVVFYKKKQCIHRGYYLTLEEAITARDSILNSEEYKT